MERNAPTHRVRRVLVVGSGQIGRPTAALLAARGADVAVVSRNRPGTLDANLGHIPCDVTDAARFEAVVAGFAPDAVVVAVNADSYSADAWRRTLLPLHASVIAACEAHRVRLVVLENLYMHGPIETIAPDSPATPVARKGVVCAELTAMHAAAASRGLVDIRLRAPDFHGEGLASAVVGEEAISNARRGRLVVVPGNPDAIHAFAHRDDVAEALASLALAPDASVRPGAIFVAPSIHLPTRELLDRYARSALGRGARARIVALPSWLLRALGVVVPFARELGEMVYQWAGPYRVDDSAYRQAFGGTARSIPAG